MDVQTEGSPTVAKSRTLLLKILFEINEITRFLKSEIEKIVIEASKSCKFTFPVMLRIPVTLSSGK